MFDDLDLSECAEIYMLASTPSYLIRRFKEAESIKRLTALYSPRQLAAEYRQLDAQEDRSLKTVVKQYMVLIALTMHQTSIAEATLTKLHYDKIGWGLWIVADRLNA